MPPLRESTAPIRNRIAEDGYALCRGLLPREDVLQLRAEVLAALDGVGWIEDVASGVPTQPGKKFGEDDWWPGYVAIQRLESFHRLAHSPRIIETLAEVFGETPLAYPMKIARAKWPGADWPTP